LTIVRQTDFSNVNVGGGRRAVFLDRDGVINKAFVLQGKPYPPKNLTEVSVLPGVAEALSQLKAAGFLLIVVTNQPDVARGNQSRSMVEAIHEQLGRQLPLDDFRICFHDTADGCDCRKPGWGLLRQAAQDHNIYLLQSFMVGDRWRDIAAGQAAGCRTIFIDYGYDEEQPKSWDWRTTSLLEAAHFIINHQ